MKIGILTFHRAHNYGAVLQAYALQEYLYSLNQKVEFIDYKNRKLLEVYRWFNYYRFKTKRIGRVLEEIKLLPYRKRRYEKFDFFINLKLNLSPKNFDLMSYDMIIIGSDQVWNTSLTNGYDKMYWGNFIFRKDCKLISYAASMQDEIKEESKDDIKKLLSRFSSISVRETSIAECLRSFVCKDVSVVLDPTLLLTKEQWGNLCHNRIVKEPYLLFYQVRKNDKAKSIAERVAKQLHLKLIHLSAGIDLHNSVDVIDSGPIEFVNLFKYANFVVCTSFHGTVFSIIFNVPFYSVLLNDGKDSRAVDLLSKLGLADRGIASYEEKELKLEIEWQKVERKLTELKKDSENYLRKFIE